MSAVIPTVLSPARVSHALASVGPPAGSASLRISITDPLAPGNGADKNIGGRPRSTSPSRAAATAFPIATVSPGSPTSTDASLTTIAPFTIAPALATANHGTGGANPTPPIPTHRTSGSGTGEPSSAATSARSLNGRRPQTAKSFRSRPDSPKTSGGRVQPVQETSSASFSATQGSYGYGGVPVPSPIQRAYISNGGTNRSSRGGLGRDRSFAGSASSATGNFRPQHGSMSGGYVGPLDSIGSALGGLGRGGSVSLQPAPGTVGGIDVARLAAIQRLLDEYDSDDAADQHLAISPRAEGSSYRQHSDSADSGRHRTSESGSGAGSASGLRTIASLRSRKDMQHWQPAVSTVKCSLEEHQQRLRERADVTLHLKRWAEQVLEDAQRAGEGELSARGSTIARAASVRFKGVTRGEDPGAAAALAEFVDPEQELDDDEERRLEALTALPPNPRGLGAQLRAHFMAVVEEEVNKKIDVIRAKWEVERGIEAEELRELRESYRDLRRMHIETKDALDKANTRMDVMRLQMRATATLNKPGKDAAVAAAAGDGDGAAAGGAKSSLRSHRSSTHDGGEGKSGGKGGKGSPSGGSGGGSHGGGPHVAHAGEACSGAYGHDDELHDKLKNIGSRRVTSPTGDGSGGDVVAAELQHQLKAQTEVTTTLNQKLQDTEQQVAKLKLDKASLENQLAAARTSSAPPEPDIGAGGGGATSPSSKYDTDIQIFKLKQEKASLEQQLAAAKSKSTVKGGSKGAGSARGGSSRALTPAKSAAAGKAADLTAEIERLNIELGASKRLAATSSKEAMDRRMELEKAKEDLAKTRATLDMAMQQLSGIKDGISREKERADRAAAAAEAAAAAQVQAEASAAAANSAVAAALIKRSAATGEVQELLGRLERERDAAVAAAAELRQQVLEMSKSLGQQEEDMMQLRDEMLKRQLEKTASTASLEEVSVPPAAVATTPPPAASLGTGLPPRPPPLTIDSGGLIPSMQSKVTAAAMAAMQTLGLPLRTTPVAARRRPTSALGPGAGAVTAGFESAMGVAAAAAAAAALVPAVLELLQQRVPDMVMGLEGDLEDESRAAAAVANLAAGAAASADAAAAAAAAAAATLRESGNAAAAAAAGATASAPIIASTFVDLVRAELLHGGTYTPTPSGAAAKAPTNAATATATAAARDSSTRAAARIERPDSLMAGSTPAEEVVSEQLDQLSTRSNDRLYVFHKGALPPVANAGGPTVSFADESAKPSVAAGGGSDGAGADRAPPPAAVVVDGITFYPLGVRESPRVTRRSPGLAAVLSGGHELVASPHRPPPPPSLPHHTPYFEAAAAAVAAAAADLLPQSVSVPVHASRSNPASAAIAAAARRRRSAFAQLHSNYLMPSPAATPTSSAPDTSSPPSRTPEPPDEEDGGVVTASGGGGAGSSGPRERLIGPAGYYYRESLDSPAQDPYYSLYVDPELASVLQVERVSPAAARAAGAGRGAISPEALGPSLRDRALSALQAPEPLPPPVQRPQSAAVRTLDAARQYILHHGGGGGGRFNQLSQTLSAALPPLAGAVPVAPPTAPAVEAPGLLAAAESGGGGGGGIAQSPQSVLAPVGLLMSGVKVRAVPANPQKGVQLSSRLRAPRQPSARGMAGRGPQEGVRFEDEEAAAAAANGPSVSGRLVPGLGLAPVMREVQLHSGTLGVDTTSGTYLVQQDGNSADGSSDLPSSNPELAALARSLMAAQERAIRELEVAMSTRRELAEEVLTSRQQWLDEARRARALENELEGVRAVLVSLGIGGQIGGAAGAGAGGGGGGSIPAVIPQLVRASGAGSLGSPALSSRRTGGSP